MRNPAAEAVRASARLARLALLALLLGLAAPPLARGEKADRDKPINLEANTMEVDDAAKVATYTGNVRLSQGTLLILADKLVVRQDAQGFTSATAYGNPASFRQKRDGVDEYIEGWAARIEYDGRRDRVELFGNARVKRGQDEVRGSYISYDAKSEFYQVKGGPDAVTETNPKGRVRAVIQPKSRNVAPPPGDGLELRPAQTPRQP
ncbi:lipopolysaccharide transport periplasmic protein LptA [Thiobacter aerophilum]|uniref:Lipopolysaccharide export system protein LptA n=1 Tax=Thiobacter aerophilum TaxID=3121275 RepID=A0ABV0ECG2_9BURK